MDYDVIVVGGGAAGENAAGYAAGHGLATALVERELVGGECSYWTCMPSKALLRPGEALAEARRVPGAAGAVTGEVDAAKTFRSRDAFASHWTDDGQAEWLDGAGVDLVRGSGRLAGPRRVEVAGDDGTRTLTASRAVVLATGSRAALPPIPGLEGVGAWDNRDVTSTTVVPDRLLVLGGGPVGVEMAQAFRRLGSGEVTLVQRSGRLLPREEPFAGEELRAALEADGVAVRTCAETTAARRENGAVVLTLAGGEEVAGDELLAATGRRPATDDLGLETVGLAPGKPVAVDDRLRAAAHGDGDGAWLYAVGDVNGRALLTHQGKYQARIAADVIAGADMRAWADEHAVPRAVCTDPQVAAVGRTEREARDAGVAVRTWSHPIGHTAAGALHGRDTPGCAHVVVDTDRRTLVGATFTGPAAGELVHTATTAIAGGVTLEQLWHAVPAFPTLSEVWLRLLEAERGA